MEETRHTSREYERELQAIRDGLLYLGAKTEKALELAIKALLERDTAVAREIIKGDDQIDRLDIELEERCIRILALRQPTARDLRFITTAIKITGHLERIGDMVVNIAEKAIILNDFPQLKPYVDLPRMGEISREMIRNSLDAMVRQDVDLARTVRAEDAVIDNLNEQIFRELVMYMLADPGNIKVSLYIMQISKTLERIADHAEGIADMVIYMVTGKIIRHEPLPVGKNEESSLQ
ncbi:MAG: phosphate signaling complex protein PhoU [Syntrophobacterales bacterium]|nr:phosphate signaling complex protein PhoU [Syntrophobacterales bacterium]